MTKRSTIIGILLILWLGVMSWLIFFEAYPDLIDRVTPGYRTLLSHGVMVMDRWMTIAYQGKTIGYTHTSVDADQSDPVLQYRINNRTLLTLNVMGHQQRIAVTADAGVDALFNLQSFTFALSSSGYTIHVTGRRTHGDSFDVKVKSPASTQRLTVTIPPDAILYSPMTEMSLRSLKPGNHVTLRIFNPVTLASQNVTVKALRRETLTIKNQSVETTVLSALVDGMETFSWIDPAGVMIRQTTPFGWSMENSTADEALSLRGGTGHDDILVGMAIPLHGDVGQFASGRPVKLRLSGVTFERQQLESQRQEVVSISSNAAEVIVKAEALPRTGCARQDIPPACKPWLDSSAFIQAQDPRMIAKAHEITGDWTNSLEAALAIFTWVNTHVTKTPVVSVPSALDVLLKPEGDCNEHTYLFVGLARAAGLPARVRVGATLHQGQLFYHAWPSVYVGQWLDMDPTLGKPAVDTGYLSLLEGEIAEQMKLMSVVGQLNVDIIDKE